MLTSRCWQLLSSTQSYIVLEPRVHACSVHVDVLGELDDQGPRGITVHRVLAAHVEQGVTNPERAPEGGWSLKLGGPLGSLDTTESAAEPLITRHTPNARERQNTHRGGSVWMILMYKLWEVTRLYWYATECSEAVPRNHKPPPSPWMSMPSVDAEVKHQAPCHFETLFIGGEYFTAFERRLYRFDCSCPAQGSLCRDLRSAVS